VRQFFLSRIRLVDSFENGLLRPMIVFVFLAGVGASDPLYVLMLFFVVDRLVEIQTNEDKKKIVLFLY
jgi:hypothetical protein